MANVETEATGGVKRSRGGELIYVDQAAKRRHALQISRLKNPPLESKRDDLNEWTTAIYRLVSATSNAKPSSSLLNHLDSLSKYAAKSDESDSSAAGRLEWNNIILPVLNYFMTIIAKDCSIDPGTAAAIDNNGEYNVPKDDTTPAAALQLYYFSLESIIAYHQVNHDGTDPPKEDDQSTVSSLMSVGFSDAAVPNAAKNDRAPWPLNGIKEPGINDCLMGRGGGTNKHPGNKKFRALVESNRAAYRSCATNEDKYRLAVKVTTVWRNQDPSGRFLKCNQDTQLWNDVGDSDARKKTSKSLGEMRPLVDREDEELSPLYAPKDGKSSKLEQPDGAISIHDERFHSSLLSLCYFCLLRAKDPEGQYFLIEDIGCPMSFYCVVESFIEVMKPGSEYMATNQTLALPSYIIRSLHQVQEMLLGYIWMTENNVSLRQTLEGRPIQGNREQELVGYILGNLVDVIKRRVSTLCELLSVPWIEATTKTTMEIFTTMLHHRTEIFFNRHPDQLMMCSLYAALCARSNSASDVLFQDIANAYIKMNRDQVGSEISYMILHRIKNCSDRDEKFGDVVSLYNQVFVPAVKPFWRRWKDWDRTFGPVWQERKQSNPSEEALPPGESMDGEVDSLNDDIMETGENDKASIDDENKASKVEENYKEEWGAALKDDEMENDEKDECICADDDGSDELALIFQQAIAAQGERKY